MVLNGFHSFPDNVTWLEHLFLGDDEGRGKPQRVGVGWLTKQSIVTKLAGKIPRTDICEHNEKCNNY